MIATIGPHRVLCGDITQGAVTALMGDERADIVYSDPPWGPGNQQYWHTMRERGAAPRTSWTDFLGHLARAVAAARKPDAPVFLEMGLRWTDDLDAAMRAVGLPLIERWGIFYGPKSKPLPNALMLFGAHPRHPVRLPKGARGQPITEAVFDAVECPGAIVLDPCTGLGMTARCATERAMIFRGVEMNAARLARTEAWLRAHAA